MYNLDSLESALESATSYISIITWTFFAVLRLKRYGRIDRKRVHCDTTEERSVQIFYIIRSFSWVFWEEEWFVGATPSTWNFRSTGSRWSEIADFEPIFASSASAVTPSEKSSILTLIGSSLRAFQWA